MDAVEKRVREILRRAGLSGVPLPVVGAAIVAALVAIVAGLWHWWPRQTAAAGFSTSASSLSAQPSKAGGSSNAPEAASAAGSSEATEGGAASVYVHVVGAVRHPGLFALPSGSRVADAIERAGGVLGSAADRAINLARLVTDGEQIVVPTQDEFAAGSSTAAPGAGAAASQGLIAPGAKVDINTADASVLDTLPGIGPSTAQKIVADREANGPFASVDDLARVTGIGPKKLEGLRDFVTVR